MGHGTPTVRRGESFMAEHDHTGSEFGKKTIGMFAGIALLINNITGPGVPSLPNMFAESGWLTPTVMLLVIWALSSVSASMYCEAMRRIPGNEHFRGRLEYTSIVDYYFGRKGYIAAQIGLNGALQSLNIISVIMSAQYMDQAIAAIGGKSCGLDISPFPLHVNGSKVDGSTTFWSCITLDEMTGAVPNSNGWGCHLVLSAGFFITLSMAIPMGYFNLDDNMIVQVVAFVLTIMCWIVWIVACFFAEPGSAGSSFTLEAVNTHAGYGSQAAVLGNILFNYGFVTTVPSWVNEKRPDVSVNKTLWSATFLCNVVFFVIGIPGALAFKDYLQGGATNTCMYAVVYLDDDGASGLCAQSLMDIFTGPLGKQVLPSIMNHKVASFVLKLSVYMFPIVAVVSSIPVFSIVIKYNCLENGWSRRSAIAWGVLFPWIVSIPLLYQPNALNQFINFSSLFFVSFTDFIVPWMLYIVMVRSEDGWTAATLHTIDEEGEREPLLSTANINTDVSDRVRRIQRPAVIEHFAIPPSWGVSAALKINLAKVFVVCMAALAIAGTVLTIQQSATGAWDCAAVGN